MGVPVRDRKVSAAALSTRRSLRPRRSRGKPGKRPRSGGGTARGRRSPKRRPLPRLPPLWLSGATGPQPRETRPRVSPRTGDQPRSRSAPFRRKPLARCALPARSSAPPRPGSPSGAGPRRAPAPSPDCRGRARRWFTPRRSPAPPPLPSPPLPVGRGWRAVEPASAMVLESVVADLLNRFLGDYVENLNKSQLKLGIWGGKEPLLSPASSPRCCGAVAVMGGGRLLAPRLGAGLVGCGPPPPPPRREGLSGCGTAVPSLRGSRSVGLRPPGTRGRAAQPRPSVRDGRSVSLWTPRRSVGRSVPVASGPFFLLPSSGGAIGAIGSVCEAAAPGGGGPPPAAVLRALPGGGHRLRPLCRREARVCL